MASSKKKRVEVAQEAEVNESEEEFDEDDMDSEDDEDEEHPMEEKSSWWYASCCCNCNVRFKRMKKGFYRFSLEKSLPLSKEIARETLSKLIGTKFDAVTSKSRGQFLCPKCWSKLRAIAKYQWALDEFLDRTKCSSYIDQKRTESSAMYEVPPKRPRFSDSPAAKRGRKRSCIPIPAQRPTKWDTIITAIRSRQYRRAIKGLAKATKGSQKQFIHCVCGVIRKEVMKLLQDETAFQLCKTVDISSIDRFSWDDTLDKLQTHAPLLSAVLHSVVSRKSGDNGLRRRNIPKLGTAVACLLHARAPKKAAFIPTVFAIQFWKGGLKRETIDQLYRTGICLTTEKTLDILDKIKRDPKTNEIVTQPVAVKTKKQLEVSPSMRATDSSIEGKSSARSDEEETILYSDDERMDIENIYPKSNDDIESDDSNDDDGGDNDDDDDDGFHGDEDDDDDDDKSDNQIAIKTEMETTLQSGVSVPKEQKSEKQVEMDFEARIPEDIDFHGMKTLLQQVFLKANIDVSELTNTIISQNYVGSIVKQPYVADDDDDDDSDSDDTVLALTTAVNITERKDLSCVKQMKGMLLEKCQKCSKEQFEKFNKLLNDPDQHVGYLVSERFLNLPPNMALPLYESLIKELEKARQKNMKYNFQYFLMICKTFLIKSSGAKKEMFFSNSEEEFFQEVGELCFSYSVAHERDSGVEKWSSEDDMEPYRTVIVFPADRLPTVVDRLKQELATSGS